MANLSSGDGVMSCTVVVNQENDGVYVIAITAVAPQNVPTAIEINGTRVYEDPGNSGTGSEG